MAMRFETIHTIGVYEQLAMMRVLQPSFTCSVSKGLLVCRGTIKPTEVNRAYKVRVEYRAKEAPRVFVDDPPLRRRKPDERIPHTYDEDRPCLFLPRSGEWRSDKFVARTIIPWLSEWLFYYEVWRATGEWLGGGVHPTVPGEPRTTEPDTFPEAA